MARGESEEQASIAPSTGQDDVACGIDVVV
jgi:hypothetical protein